MRGIPGTWFEDQLGSEMLGEILVDQNVINKSQLSCALSIAKDRGQMIGKTLMDLELATLDQINYALETQQSRASSV